MSDEYQGSGSVVPLNDVDGFLKQLERNRGADPQPTQQQAQPAEYKQTSSPALDQFLKDLEEGRGIKDGSPEVVSGQPESTPAPRSRTESIPKAISKKRYNLVGGGPKVQANPRYVERSDLLDRPAAEWDALSVGPKPPAPIKYPKPGLKLFS